MIIDMVYRTYPSPPGGGDLDLYRQITDLTFSCLQSVWICMVWLR